MKIEALVVGASGIVGRGVSEILLDQGAVVHGLSRHADGLIPGVQHVAVDLLKGAAAETLSRLRPTHVYLATWVRRPTEQENIETNAGIVRAVLGALSGRKECEARGVVYGAQALSRTVESYARTGTLPLTPVREEHPRLDAANFYYVQEDELYAALSAMASPGAYIGLTPSSGRRSETR